MKKTVFIGDIHGDLDFVIFIDKQYEGWKKVFVGDFVDSFYFSPSTAVDALWHVLQMCERGDTRALLGNHELSYLFEGNRCGGWNATTEVLLIPIRSKMLRILEYYIWYPDEKILVTHGGITRDLWKAEELTPENLVFKLDGWKKQDLRMSKFGWIGKSRGGIDPYGGPFWCDFDKEFQPVVGITQIFGHTPGREIRQVDRSFCINQLERMMTREVLEYQDGQFQVAQFSSNLDALNGWRPEFTRVNESGDEEFRNRMNKVTK